MYKLQVNNNIVVSILFLASNTTIPIDIDNTDYQVYLKWLDGYEFINGEWIKTSEGNTPLPADS